VATPTDDGRIVYFSITTEEPARFYVELADASLDEDAVPDTPLLEFRDVDFERLAELVSQHLSLAANP
jgi:hypothetical protein